MDKGVLGPLDALLDFGEATLGSGTVVFPDVIDLGTTNADGLEVVANLPVAAVGGTNAKLVLKGSNTNSGWQEIVTGPVVVLADMNKGENLHVPIPRNTKYRYLQLSVVQTGEFSAGKLHGWLDTFIGR